LGWGDEIIASGQARLLRLSEPRYKVGIYDRNGALRSHDAWLYNPNIAGRNDPTGRVTELRNGPGMRPYIRSKHPDRWEWKSWECPVGEIYFSEYEREIAQRFSWDIIIEPNLKAKASPNKDWGLARWQELTRILLASGRAVFQLGPMGTRVLTGARLIETQTMRQACAMLWRARGAVLPEGGLHHSAAALGVKSIVIFGGYISPKQTGYASQVNLFTGGEPCGWRAPCQHCAKAMSSITPEEVAAAALEEF
jgi:hypothetical protein